MANLFRKSTQLLNEELQNKKLSHPMNKKEKKQLFEQTKMYIFLQELIESIHTHLMPDEMIQSYLPLTSDGSNLSFMNVGIAGMYHPKTKKARAYARTFNDLRGNRLIIFTSERIIFMTIIEYLDQELFYSYPYEKIHTFTLLQNKMSYFDWGQSFPPRRRPLYSYFFDFECENKIFSELLNEKDKEVLLQQIRSNDKMKHIDISEKVYRKKKFDFLLNNGLLGYRLMNLSFLGLFILFIVLFILAMFFDIGPFTTYIP